MTGYSQRELKHRILEKLSDQDKAAYRLAAAVNATVFSVLIMFAIIVMTMADLDPQLAYDLAISNKPVPPPAVAQNTPPPKR